MHQLNNQREHEHRFAYCLISPCRDEAEFVRRTLDSVIRQTIRPAKWVIVDDGSTDGTSEILREYSQLHPWIHVVNRSNRGTRVVGSGVIDAFYDGYSAIDPSQFSYICKLDVDLDLPPGYFETLMRKMTEEPRIGTCSGKAYYRAEGRLISEGGGDENAFGCAKFYRASCFQEIGGFVRQVMWDGIDGHTCRLLGWIAISWDDAELRFEHLRPMGSSHKGIWTGRKRHGYGQWFMGTGLSYMAASALFRMSRPPILVGGLAMMVGYLEAMVRRKPRYDRPGFRRFLRRYQWNCLLRGKKKATESLNEAQAAVWQARHRDLEPAP